MRRVVLCLAFYLMGAFADGVQSSEAIRLPWIKQKTESECGRAVLASLASRHSGDAERAYSQILPPQFAERGYSLPEMAINAQNLGLVLLPVIPTTILDGCTSKMKNSAAVREHFKNIAKAIKNGDPIVILKRLEAVTGHFAILVDFKETGFVAHDPSKEELQVITFGTLADDICASGYLALAACTDKACIERYVRRPE